MFPNNPVILVVVERLMDRQLYQSELENNGFNFLASSGYEETLSVLCQGAVDMVVLDTSENIGLMHSLQQASGVPIVIVSSKGLTIDKIRGLNAGAADYLSRPFNPEELRARLRAVLRSVARSFLIPVNKRQDISYRSLNL